MESLMESSDFPWEYNSYTGINNTVFSWTNPYFIHPYLDFSWSDIFLQFLIGISLIYINL